MRVSELRILDQLIWFDWNMVKDGRRFVVRGFSSWVYDPNHDEWGVYRK